MDKQSEKWRKTAKDPEDWKLVNETTAKYQGTHWGGNCNRMQGRIVEDLNKRCGKPVKIERLMKVNLRGEIKQLT